MQPATSLACFCATNVMTCEASQQPRNEVVVSADFKRWHLLSPVELTKKLTNLDRTGSTELASGAKEEETCRRSFLG